ncbi:hypothetical protein GCM10029964_038030 [Kibdelosporangium lantanae]
MTFVGKPVDRVDGPAKTTGAARFSAEYPYPDLAHAALVHATVSRGRITAIDTADAAKVPGVVEVLTHLNVPALKPAPKVTTLNIASRVSGSSVNYLGTDEVHWDGQPVAVVVAETSTAARQAAGLVRVEYSTMDSTVDFETAEPKPQPKNLLLPAGGSRVTHAPRSPRPRCPWTSGTPRPR